MRFSSEAYKNNKPPAAVAVNAVLVADEGYTCKDGQDSSAD